MPVLSPSIRDVGRFATFLGAHLIQRRRYDLRRFQIEHRNAGVPTPTIKAFIAFDHLVADALQAATFLLVFLGALFSFVLGRSVWQAQIVFLHSRGTRRDRSMVIPIFVDIDVYG